jgi:hypothetical protein
LKWIRDRSGNASLLEAGEELVVGEFIDETRETGDLRGIEAPVTVGSLVTRTVFHAVRALDTAQMV